MTDCNSCECIECMNTIDCEECANCAEGNTHVNGCENFVQKLVDSDLNNFKDMLDRSEGDANYTVEEGTIFVDGEEIAVVNVSFCKLETGKCCIGVFHKGTEELLYFTIGTCEVEEHI